MAAGDENEFQPEAPDMASAMQLDTDETLTGPSDTDPLDSGYVPPDRPYGVEDNAVTPAGAREGESHDARIAREIPDSEPPPDTGRSGRLAGTVDGADGAPAEEGGASEVGIDGGAASAEEAAVHDVDAGVEPVLDESPVGDPEVSRQLAEDDHAEQARADAEWDTGTDPEWAGSPRNA